MANSLKLSLLGLPIIELNGKVVELKRPRAINLLAYLAMHHPEEHPREKLADVFWGESDSESARLSLRVTINDLRKTLGEEWFSGGRNSLGIRPHVKVDVDALEFQQLTKSKTAVDWEEAIQLYHGDFLPEADNAWAFEWREKLSQLRSDTLLQLASHFRAKAEYGKAIEFAQDLIKHDPSNETAHQHIMVCYEALGDRSAALKQYDACIESLNEAGIESSQMTEAIHQRLIRTASPASLAAHPTNLPTRLTSFIGREAELETIENYLSPVSHDGLSTRLVTLTGAGGSGKSSLSVQAASELVDTYEHGVWWVELASLTREQDVLHEVANVLGIKESPEISIHDAMLEKIRRRHLLLIFDNCEHLIEACAAFAADILQNCPHVQILATSREPLSIPGEQVYPVPTMDLPDIDLSTIDEAMKIEAVKLFTERAQSINPSFQLNEENMIDVISICRRLDGIPLAIELAASRMKSLSPSELSARLDDRFKLLTSGDRAVLPRQKTLHALIDWSYNLLDEEEKTLFRRLSTLPGGCTLEAAEALGSDLSTPVIELVNRLVEKSLMLAINTESGTRYRMLDSIRYFGLDLFKETKEAASIMSLSLDFFANFVDELELFFSSLKYSHTSSKKLENEQDNLRELLEWSLTHAPETAMRVAGGLWSYWQSVDQFLEGEVWLSRALEAAPKNVDIRWRARALSGAGTMAFNLGKFREAVDLHKQALEAYRQCGDLNGEAFSLNNIGVNEINSGNKDEFLKYTNEALTLAYRIDDKKVIAYTGITMGLFLELDGRFEDARDHFTKALDVGRQIQSDAYIATILHNLGELSFLTNDLNESLDYYDEADKIGTKIKFNYLVHENYRARARVYFKKGEMVRAVSEFKVALHYFHQIGSLRYTLMTLQWLAICQTQIGYHREASSLFGTVTASVDKFSLNKADFEHDEMKEALQILQKNLSARQFELAWEEGRYRSIDEAVENTMAIE